MRSAIAIAFIVALAPTVSAAGKFVELERITSGQLVYYGHFLQPPYILGSDGTQLMLRCPADTAFAAAGLREVPWALPVPRPPSPPISRTDSLRYARMQEHSLRVIEQSRAAYASGLRGLEWMERKAAAYRASPLVDSARVLDSSSILVHWKDDHPSTAMEREPPAVPVTRDSTLRMRARQLAGYLAGGSLVAVDFGIEWTTPAHDCSLALAELKSLRTGGTPKRLRIHPELIKRFRQPLPSLRTLVEGR